MLCGVLGVFNMVFGFLVVMVGFVVGYADAVRDAGPISRLINICVGERKTVLNPFSPEEERVYLLGLGSREAVFVAYIGSEFAGFAGVAPRWRYSDRLCHCGEPGTWVMPEHRGKGVGRALWVEGIFPWCRKHGFTHLGASVMAHNTGSIAFYEKLGFQVCGYHRKMVDWNGEKLENIFIPRSKECDLREMENCLNETKNKDLVVHLAANVGGIGYNQKYPGSLFYDNAVMGINLIEASRINHVKKIVLVGTVCAYQKYTPVPFKESELWNGYPEETNAPYGIAKKNTTNPSSSIPTTVWLKCNIPITRESLWSRRQLSPRPFTRDSRAYQKND